MSFFSPKKHENPHTVEVRSVSTQGSLRGARGDGFVERREIVETARSGTHSPAEVSAHLPNGVLIKVKGTSAYFDLDGFYCIRGGESVIVTRGAPRKIMALLTKKQRADLHRARLSATRRGAR